MPATKLKRTIILMTSLALLVVLLIVFTNPRSTLAAKSKNIALKSAAEVDRIVLADAHDSTELLRQGELWLINGSEVATEIPVENILIAAERMEISSIVSNGPELPIGPSRSIAFFNGDKVLLNYRLQIQNESYLLNLPGSDQSFYVKVSGYPGLNLEKVFSSSPNHSTPESFRGTLGSRPKAYSARFSSPSKSGSRNGAPDPAARWPGVKWIRSQPP